MKYIPAETREDRVLNGQTWSALWGVFRLRFGLRHRNPDTALATSLLLWSLTDEGRAEYFRLRKLAHYTPKPVLPPVHRRPRMDDDDDWGDANDLYRPYEP